MKYSTNYDFVFIYHRTDQILMYTKYVGMWPLMVACKSVSVLFFAAAKVRETAMVKR